MSDKGFRRHLRPLLASAAALGVAGAVVVNGMPGAVTPSWADPVRVEGVQAPSFADVVEAVSPAVVSVRVQSRVDPVADRGGFSFDFGGPGFDDLPDDHPMKRFFREFRRYGFGDEDREQRRPRGVRPVSQGSGFFISEDGYIVTNNHVIDNGETFTIIRNDGSELTASLVGSDSRTDLAVLRIDEPGDREFTYVDFADDERVRIGDWVVAVGNPFGLGGSVTAGIVSARGRNIGAGPYDDFIQVDAAVNRGNSGGPTFNLEGQVIGVNTAIFSPSGGNVGIAFAIPASIAKEVVTDLIDDGSVERGWLGVQIQPVTDDIAESLGLAEAKGALVTTPQDGAPAADAGIAAGDVVTAVNGEPVEDPRALARTIAAIEPGSTAEITVWNEGQSRTVDVEIGMLPDVQRSALDEDDQRQPLPSGDQTLEDFGMTVVPSEDGRGVVVTDVAPNSPAGERGLEAGDVILSVNNQPVSSVDEILSVINEAAESGRKAALFQVENDQRSRFVALPIDIG